ncbi:hypothetical protein [Aliiglaciecola sp. M165]|uniref:hypothetical protein n=1 Tax=Aliiglaciecola sp. M165 TaxID=2593649 RepID=UPI00117D02E9|nr:hypothetical protein [Aliiglaciecola sp. M165]TRY31291.1 hypothetical protein FM019_10450 [Aliiglaciecola sp. M165]
MLKKLIIASIAITFSISVSASEPVCAGIEMIYDENGELIPLDRSVHQIDESTPIFYRNSEFIPNVSIGPRRFTNIYVKNISDRAVNFFFEPVYHSYTSGQLATVSPEQLYGVFESANSPMSSSGAFMLANTLGRIYFYYSSQEYQLSGNIYWDSATCSTSPMVVTVESYFYQNYSSGRGGIDNYYVNNGQPF